MHKSRVVSLLATAALAAAPLLALPTAAHAAGAAVADSVTVNDMMNGTSTATSLAQSLAGTGVSVSNATYRGLENQFGSLHVADRQVVGFNDGVILSTGDVANSVGPNKSGGSGTFIQSLGDTSLNALISTSNTANHVTYDASVLEFDFVPTASTVYFTYTFASDEYPQSANFYNDVFAAYVNGTNCATVPNPAGGANPAVAVSAGTINATVNSSLFRNNSFTTPPTNPINIEYDGLSVELVCSAAVNQGVTNHIKLAIADTNYGWVDSAVMVKAHSLSTVRSESCNNGIDDNADAKIDLADPLCSNSTSAAPIGQVGIGGTTHTPLPANPIDLTTVAYPNAPAFTGNEGTPILLDAAAVDVWPTGGTYFTSWDVSPTGSTTGSCTVSAVDPQPLSDYDGSIGLAYAVCSDEGEYVATVTGYATQDTFSATGFVDEIDFVVHNAPPAVDLTSPKAGDITYKPYGANANDTAKAVSISAKVFDPGINDSVSCTIDWGDGNQADATIDPVTGVCSGSNIYLDPTKVANPLIVNNQVIAVVTATDGFGATSSAATVFNFGTIVKKNQTITFAQPTTPQTYGDSFTVTATSSSALAVVITTTGSCSASGFVITMTSGTGTCTIKADQNGLDPNGGPALYNAATQVTKTVTAAKRAVEVTATPQSKVFGAADPTPWAYTITKGSLAGADAFTGALTRTAGTAVGSYAITQGNLALATANYTLTFVPGTLTITGALPAITTQPVGRTVLPNQSVVLTVAGTGTPTPTVQWQKQQVNSSWAAVSGQTALTFTAPTTPADDGAVYRAVLTNGLGTATSSSATVNVISISGFNVSTAVAGVTTLTINGSGFGGVQTVRFAGAQTNTFTKVSTKQITVTVPASATTGQVSVIQGVLFAKSSTSLTVTAPTVTPAAAPKPVVSALTLRRASAGTTVTITGAHFTGSTGVVFAGTSVTTSFVVVSSTKILATVPIGATTGSITIKHPSGDATTPTFTIAAGSTVPKVATVTLRSTTPSVSASLLLTGANIGSATSISINSTSLSFTPVSADKVIVTLPISGSKVGKVISPIIVNNGVASSRNTKRMRVLNWQ